jgi:proteasome lid subunit RPN8/RPN11
MFQWLSKLVRWWRGDRTATAPSRLARITLTDGITKTLFEDYAEHRRSERGDEEIGWILLGIRQGSEAIALAALPAGAHRDAGAAHIRFNSDAQAVGCRILRQHDKRLQIIGVVHTHPGSLRQPSGVDFAGDSAWVGQLRSAEAVFGIGTADANNGATGGHAQVHGELCFHWYALGAGDDDYRTLPLKITPGPDLASPLRSIWETIELHARPIDQLCRQLAEIQLEAIDDEATKVLCVKITLVEPTQQLRVLLDGSEARYYWDRNGELVAIDPHEPQLDRAVYLILAELAKAPAVRETPTLIEA